MLNPARVEFFHAIREAYQVSIEQIEAAGATPATMPPEERLGFQKECLLTVSRIVLRQVRAEAR